MQVQKIRRAIDLSNTSQDRIILQLACGHNISLGRQAVAAMPPVQAVMLFEAGTEWHCAFCPDPAPPTPEDVRRTKTANQLWKEAGQP